MARRGRAPTSIMVGVGRGAQAGVLVKNAEAVRDLHALGLKLIMLTGDNRLQ